MATLEQLKPVIDALTTYQQDQQTLQPVVNAAEALYGQDWTSLLMQDLDALPGVDQTTLNMLKEKADHAIHYYGALAAWEEAHQYLNATEPVDSNLLEERIPTLEYWLALFGDEGNKVVLKLKQLLANLSPVQPAPVQVSIENDIQSSNGDELLKTRPEETAPEHIPEEQNIPNEENHEQVIESQDISKDIPLQTQNDIDVYPQSISSDTILTEDDILDIEKPLSSLSTEEDNLNTEDYSHTDTVSQTISDEHFVENEKTNNVSSLEKTDLKQSEQVVPLTQEPEEIVSSMPQEEDSSLVVSNPLTKDTPEELPKNFEISTYLKERELYEQVIAWVTAKCIHLGNIELTAYPHYGFVVDLMRSLKENIQNLLDNQLFAEVIEQQLPGGRKGLEDYLKFLNTELAHLPEVEEKPAENIIDGVDPRSLFGQIDTSNQKEYLGPAPDGFELMDDPYSKEETSKEELLKAYEKTEENMGDSISRLDILENPMSSTEKTSETIQKR